MNRGATISSLLARIVIGAAAKRGVDPRDLIRDAGLPPDVLADEDVRLPAPLDARLWGEAIRLSGDSDLPLHAAEMLEPDTFGAADFAARSSATLGEGYRRLIRYHRLVHEGVRLTLEVRGPVAVFTHSTHGAAVEPSRGRSEFALATLLVAGRQATGVHWRPWKVAFQHRRPPQVEEHARIFGCPIYFGASRTQLTLDARLLSLPCVRADSALCTVLDRQATGQLEQLPTGTTLAERVRRVLAEHLSSGGASAAVVARRLHLSPRHLQRCLAREGTSFRALATSMRRDLAKHLLLDTSVPVSEAARRLGFAAPSAFYRTFRQWFGTTPAEFRRRHTAG